MSNGTEYSHNRYMKNQARIAEGLRELAADIDRIKIHQSLKTMRSDHADAAQQVIHKVMWGLANLSLDGLVNSATEADDIAAYEIEEQA